MKFEVSQRISGGETKTFAANVEPIFEMSEPENISGYRETSEVLNLNRRKGFGFVRRPCGDALFFHKSEVVQGFENRWDFLEVGSPVWHGVKFDGSTGLWRAVDIELYGYEELQSFKNEPAYEEPEPETASVLAPEPTAVKLQSELFRPENCRRTLLDLIQERRGKR